MPIVFRALRRWIAAGGFVLLFFVAVHATSLDGLDGLLFEAAGFRDGSEWAPAYSAIGFWRVRQGMTSDQVLALVGAPLEEYSVEGRPGLTGWRWTRNPHDTNYKVRVVLLSNNRVLEKLSEFYVD